jgi:hypothetical protein
MVGVMDEPVEDGVGDASAFQGRPEQSPTGGWELSSVAPLPPQRTSSEIGDGIARTSGPDWKRHPALGSVRQREQITKIMRVVSM